MLIAATAKGADTDYTKMKKYIYRLNFQCFANSIEEADKCFEENTKLVFKGKKEQPGYMSTSVSVEIISPPMYPEITEQPPVRITE
jgi:hypothetical protein